MELSENKEIAQVQDLSARMLLKTEENGRGVEEEIAVNITGLFFDGIGTTRTAITFIMNYLAEFPHVYSEVLKGIHSQHL